MNASLYEAARGTEGGGGRKETLYGLIRRKGGIFLVEGGTPHSRRGIRGELIQEKIGEANNLFECGGEKARGRLKKP